MNIYRKYEHFIRSVCVCSDSNRAYYVGIFHPLEVVDRGSETQIQVNEKKYYSAL